MRGSFEMDCSFWALKANLPAFTGTDGHAKHGVKARCSKRFARRNVHLGGLQHRSNPGLTRRLGRQPGQEAFQQSPLNPSGFNGVSAARDGQRKACTDDFALTQLAGTGHRLPRIILQDDGPCGTYSLDDVIAVRGRKVRNPLDGRMPRHDAHLPTPVDPLDAPAYLTEAMMMPGL
jgi:hypothetical protein